MSRSPSRNAAFVAPLGLAVILLASLFYPVLPAPAAPAGTPHVITLPIAGGEPTALGVYSTGNKLIVADSADGSLLLFGGSSLQLLADLPAGRNVYDGALVVDEAYGKAYAASRDGDQGGGEGTGAIYVVNLANNSLAATLPPRVAWGNGFALGHDPVRHRVYVADYGSLSWINVATNVITSIPPPPEAGDLFFRASEIAVNTATNDVFLIQDGTYDFHRLWILDGDTWNWSSIDFPTLGAYYPQHVAVSEAENKVFVKLVGIPGQAEPGLFVLDRNNGEQAFIGNDDYGMLAVNPSSGRLFTGIEVGQNVAVVDVATNTLFNVPVAELAGAAVPVDIRLSTDHAFIADQSYVLIVDGASRTHLSLPVSGTSGGGLLAQDVEVNDATGRAYLIPDNREPFVVVVDDLPPGPVDGGSPTPSQTPTSTAVPDQTPTSTPTASSSPTPTGSATGVGAGKIHLPLIIRTAPPPATPNRRLEGRLGAPGAQRWQN